MIAFNPLYLVLLVNILVWGLSWPINKLAMQAMSPIWFTSIRLMLGTGFTLLVLALLGKLKRPSGQDCRVIFIVGVLQVGLFAVLITFGLSFVHAGRSAILAYTTPLWVVPIATFYFKEKLTFFKLIGFLFGMLGVFALVNPFSIDWQLPHQILGHSLLLLAAGCLASAMLFSRHLSTKLDTTSLLGWQLLAGSIPVSLFAWVYDPHPVLVFNALTMNALIYTSILGTAFGYWGFTLTSKKLPSMTVSLSYLLVPLIGALSSAVILHEPLSKPIQLALIFIPVGLSCIIWDTQRLTKCTIK